MYWIPTCSGKRALFSFGNCYSQGKLYVLYRRQNALMTHYNLTEADTR